ncbi:MAG TPA: response regulator transcription factor [Solirubrobacteraceae bacterium]|nr:response regulator transcription factor [Solirubrobacteraceae bacterium]
MADSADALRVVLADDHHFFREGLRGTLELEGMIVVGEAADGEEAVELVHQLAPDVVVLDLNMPNTSGIEAIQQIAGANPEIPVVVLTVSVDNADVVDALAAGACSYLLKDAQVSELASGIRQAASGHAVLSREVAQALLTRVRAQTDADESNGAIDGNGNPIAMPALTGREMEVLRLIAEGADNAAIGRELSISPHTVKQYVTNIFEKLEVNSRVQAAVYAVRAGLV